MHKDVRQGHDAILKLPGEVRYLPPWTDRVGDKRRTLLLRLDREPGVVARDVDLPKSPIGGLHRADPSQRKFLRQPVLESSESPFRPPARFR